MTDDQTENRILRNNVSERDISDSRYAMKIVETIVFGAIGLVCLWFMAKLTGKV
jgi:hypothetical protein